MDKHDDLLEQYAGYMYRHIRKMWGWWPPARKAKHEHFLGRDKQGTEVFWCAECKLKVPWVEKDHIEPVVPLTGREGLQVEFDRTFVPREKIQILCGDCHKAKSKREAAVRAKHRRAKKEKGK